MGSDKGIKEMFHVLAHLGGLLYLLKFIFRGLINAFQYRIYIFSGVNRYHTLAEEKLKLVMKLTLRNYRELLDVPDLHNMQEFNNHFNPDLSLGIDFEESKIGLLINLDKINSEDKSKVSILTNLLIY